MASRIIEDAAALARAGFAVFPCRHDKTPATPRGFKDAIADASQVRALFDRAGAALIGIATGRASGAAVLDIDPPAGLDWLADHAHRLPDTVQVQTRRGGWHFWFGLADGDSEPLTSAGRIAPSIDVRGRGGYAIAWDVPQLLAGRERMAAWPAWLVPPAAAPRTPFAHHVPLRDRDAGHGRRYALAALRHAVLRVAGAAEGGRNVALNREAYALARLVGPDLGAGEVQAALGAAAAAAGLDARETAATLRSALGARGAVA